MLPLLPWLWCSSSSFLLLLFLHPPSPSYSQPSFFFNKTSPPAASDFDTSILPTGETYNGTRPQLNASQVWLIPEPTSNIPRNKSVGRIVYNKSITFVEASGAFASFDTTIAFQIFTVNESSGEGMAFFVAQDPTFPHSSAGGYMGLSNATFNKTPVAELDNHRFFAVEFDMYQQSDLNDPSGDHVGINVNSMESIITANVSNSTTPAASGSMYSDMSSSDISLHQNHTFITRIVFDATSNIARVWLLTADSDSELSIDISSQAPILEAPINPSDAFSTSEMWVGITATSGRGNAAVGADAESDPSGYAVYSWEFLTSVGEFDSSASPALSPTSDSMGVDPIGAPRDQRAKAKSPSISSKLIVPIVLPLMCVAVLMLIALGFYRRRRRIRNRNNKMNSDLRASHAVGSTRSFSYRSLKKATDNFSDKCLLGEGGYGKVYKGTLRHDGSNVNVAIKKLMKSCTEREEAAFASEVRIISNIRHRNLLHLIGWCYEKRKALLVYEYAENGSLEKLLYDKTKMQLLPSERRVRILVGVATALEYLHEGLGECVLHRDVKAANVLLNREWEALLGDFGLAKLVSHEKMGATMTAVAGTLGYMAPEVIVTAHATEKADVYSFGVLALEMACGRRVLQLDVNINVPEEEINLVEWVRLLAQSGRLMDAIDLGMFTQESQDEWERDVGRWKGVIHLALMCCHPQKERRPSMRQARRILVDGLTVELLNAWPAADYVGGSVGEQRGGGEGSDSIVESKSA